jgi:hypothetical protein
MTSSEYGKQHDSATGIYREANTIMFSKIIIVLEIIVFMNSLQGLPRARRLANSIMGLQAM